MEDKINVGKLFGSFRGLIVALLALFLVFASTISLLVSWQYSQSMWKRQSETTLASFSVATNQIHTLLNSAMSAARQEEGVDEYLWGTFYSDIARVRARQEMWNTISDSMRKNSALQGLFFLKTDGSLHGYSTPWAFLKDEGKHPFSEEPKLQSAGQNGSVAWIAPFQLQDLTRERSTSICMDNVLVLGVVQSKYVLSYGDTPTTLTTLAAVNIDTLCDCFEYLSTSKESVYLANEDGECIVVAGEPWKQGVIECWPCVNTSEYKGSVKWESPEDGLQYVVYHKVPSTGWYLVKTTPAQLYERDIAALQRATILTSICLIAVMLVVFMLWPVKMTVSLRKINTAMEKMREGDLSVRIREPLNIRE